MYHTLIVHAEMLNRYADRRDSQSDIPELVYLLVRQSVPNTSICRIPYGDSVNQPGWDGIVEAASSYREFVPNGTSFGKSVQETIHNRKLQRCLELGPTIYAIPLG